MKKILLLFSAVISVCLVNGQPTDWQNFSATSCDGKTQSIKNVIEDSLKPLVLIWEGHDCPFCREDGTAWAVSAKAFGNTMVYWNAFGRINGNATCDEAASWGREFGVPSRNFVFIDKLAENNWSQPVAGQGRWYWVISRDRITKQMRIAYSGNIVKDAETIGRRAVGDFNNLTAVEEVSSLVSSINLFPNPASELLTIEMKLNSSASIETEVFDLAGKSYGITQASDVLNFSQDINTSSLPSGMYILNYKIDGIQSSKLFVVQ